MVLWVSVITSCTQQQEMQCLVCILFPLPSPLLLLSLPSLLAFSSRNVIWMRSCNYCSHFHTIQTSLLRLDRCLMNFLCVWDIMVAPSSLVFCCFVFTSPSFLLPLLFPLPFCFFLFSFLTPLASPLSLSLLNVLALCVVCMCVCNVCVLCYIGGVDQRYSQGNMTYTPITKDTYYVVKMTDITVNGVSISKLLLVCCCCCCCCCDCCYCCCCSGGC